MSRHRLGRSGHAAYVDVPSPRIRRSLLREACSSWRPPRYVVLASLRCTAQDPAPPPPGTSSVRPKDRLRLQYRDAALCWRHSMRPACGREHMSCQASHACTSRRLPLQSACGLKSLPCRLLRVRMSHHSGELNPILMQPKQWPRCSMLGSGSVHARRFATPQASFDFLMISCD